VLKIEFNENANNFAVTAEDGLAIQQFRTRKEAEDFLAEQDLESKERTSENVEYKLRKLVNDCPTFEIFQQKLQSFMRFYLGEPVPEPYVKWGWSQFQKFYLDNKSK
jgi:hypothetical protein